MIAKGAVDEMKSPRLTIVIAVKGGEANLSSILQHLVSPNREAVEVLFCVAGPMPEALRSGAGFRLIEADAADLVPQLWRDGFLASQADRVALTTAQFTPPEAWVDGLLAADLDQWAGVGGPIESDAENNPVRWAAYFLRYWKFAPPVRLGAVDEIAADNAVYRRAEVMKHPDLLAAGFWEPSFHARFRADGQRLCLDERLISIYRGHDSVGVFSRQRFAHGREYAVTRGRRRSRAAAFAYLLATPLLPPLLLGRIGSKAVQQRALLVRMALALPWLLLFVMAWSLGEAAGYLDAAFAPRGPGHRHEGDGY